jgi:hypothetical protein
LRHRFRPTYPDFPRGAPPTSVCAAFIEESRMKFANASQDPQEIRSTPVRTRGTRLMPSALA